MDGGLYIYNSGTYLFTKCAFDTCTATGNGGGVALSVSDVPFHYCSFIGYASDITTADYGGAVYRNSGGNDYDRHCTFSLIGEFLWRGLKATA